MPACKQHPGQRRGDLISWSIRGSAAATVGIVLIPILLLFSIAAAIVWLTHLSPARPFFASCIGIVGPFFASVGLLFGLFAAFLANDVQHQNAEIKSAVFREADGIRTLLRLAEALGDTGRPLEAATLGYAQAVLDNEWPAMQQPGSATEFLGALRNLARAVLAPDLIAAVPTAVHRRFSTAWSRFVRHGGTAYPCSPARATP